MIHTSSLFCDRAGIIRPDLIPLAAFLCAEEYDDSARSIVLDHAAAGAPLADLTVPTPEGHLILEPYDLAGAEEALRRGGPAPTVEPAGAPAPAPVAGGAPALADQVAAEARRFRLNSGSPAGRLIADQLERLAQLVAFTGARSSQDFADRLEAHECALLATEYDRGFSDGRSRSAGYCPR